MEMTMEMERATEHQRRVAEEHWLRLQSVPTTTLGLKVAAAEVILRPAGKLCEAVVTWERAYGSTILARGPFEKVIDRVREVSRDGLDVPPVYEGGLDRLNIVDFYDDTTRAIVPQGEIRFKPFLDKSIAMLVSADQSVRFCHLGTYEILTGLAETHTTEWVLYPRVVVFFWGKYREFKASNITGELAMSRLDAHTKLVLVPDSLGPSGACVKLELMSDDDEVELLAVLPILRKHPEPVLWSDGSVRHPGIGGARRPQAPRQTARARTTTVRSTPVKSMPRKVAPPRAPETPMEPAVQEMLGRYLEEVREAAGPGKSMRAEISPLQRCAEKGVRIRGRGAPLRRGLEEASEFTFRGGTRTFQNFVKGLVDDGILARLCEDGREREFVFDELFDPDSETVERLYRRYGITRGRSTSAPAEAPEGAEAEPDIPAEDEVVAPGGSESSSAAANPTKKAVAEEPGVQPGEGGPRPGVAPSPQAPSAPPTPRRDPRVQPRPMFYKPSIAWGGPDDDGDSGGGSGSA